MKMEPIEVSEKSTYSIQMPGNYPKEENTLQSQHGESLKAKPLTYYWNKIFLEKLRFLHPVMKFPHLTENGGSLSYS
jgi:hypothetical protein